MAKMIKAVVGGDEMMTEILVRGLTVHGPADAYCVGHCSDQLGNGLQVKCGVHYVKNIIDIIPNAAIVFLTFNASDAEILLPRIAKKVKSWALIVSAIHGLTLETLEKFFPENEILRLAVNPSIISGQGLGAYALSKNASTDANSIAEIVLKDCGDVIAVKNEDELEKISHFLTANSYLSYVVTQMMIDSAKKIGMNPEEAKIAARKLLRGSLHTIFDFGKDAESLIRRSVNDKTMQTEAMELMKNYGISEALIKNISEPEPEPEEQPNPMDDPKNFRMHYQWSGH